MRYEHVINEEEISFLPGEGHRMLFISRANLFEYRELNRRPIPIIGVEGELFLGKLCSQNLLHSSRQARNVKERRVLKPHQLARSRVPYDRIEYLTSTKTLFVFPFKTDRRLAAIIFD